MFNFVCISVCGVLSCIVITSLGPGSWLFLCPLVCILCAVCHTLFALLLNVIGRLWRFFWHLRLFVFFTAPYVH